MVDYIEKAKTEIKKGDLEQAYLYAEYETLLNPARWEAYLLKSVILAEKFWEQRELFEKHSGRSFSAITEGETGESET